MVLYSLLYLKRKSHQTVSNQCVKGHNTLIEYAIFFTQQGTLYSLFNIRPRTRGGDIGSSRRQVRVGEDEVREEEEEEEGYKSADGAGDGDPEDLDEEEDNDFFLNL